MIEKSDIVAKLKPNKMKICYNKARKCSMEENILSMEFNQLIFFLPFICIFHT